MTRRLTFLLCIASLSIACGDDGGGGSDGTTEATSGSGTASSGPTSATDSGSTSGPGTSSTASATDSGSGPGTTTTTSGSDTGTAGSSSGGSAGTTGGVEGEVLQNDSWMPGDGLSWQTWPGQVDCWASIYDIKQQQYPFDIVAVRPAIGGSADTKTYHVAIWSVTNQGEPDQEIDGADVQIQGDVGFIDIVLADEGITVPTIQNGSFATVMCHTEHMGAPSIAVDTDGNVDGANNWVWSAAQNNWISAPDYFGISGDFIMRTIIQPG